MEDPNLILTLKMADQHGIEALRLPHNKQWHLPKSSSGSRGLIPLPDSIESELRLTFDKPPKDMRLGWVFGSNPRVCDFLLAERDDPLPISGQHFRIAFDAQRRIILEDISKAGTAVSYTVGGKLQAGNGRRTKFTWIFFKEPDVAIHVLDGKKFTFKVKLATHDTCHAEFETRLKSFLEESDDAVAYFNTLQLFSQATTVLVPATPPKAHQIFLKDQWLGTGASGTVYQGTNVSTGALCAIKEFSRRDDYKREVMMLKRFSHEHIVKVSDWNDTALSLVMEYFPHGDLLKQDSESELSRKEIEMLLWQGLQALEYLHAKGVTHRDIKPGNILVQGRQPFHIKLANFGFSNEISSMKSNCGTSAYMAPEILENLTYTNKVDVWSLGVVGFDCFRRWTTADVHPTDTSQCEGVARAIADSIRRNPDKPLLQLLGSMLKINPLERLSASDCLKKARDLGLGYPDMVPSSSGNITPTQGNLSAHGSMDERAGFIGGTPATGSTSLKRQRSPSASSADRPSKRQSIKIQRADIRCNEGSFSITQSPTQSPSQLPCTLESAVIARGPVPDIVHAILGYLQIQSEVRKGVDNPTSNQIEKVCDHFTRMELTAVKFRNLHSGVEITAITKRGEVALTIPAFPDPPSMGDFASYLLNLLQEEP